MLLTPKPLVLPDDEANRTLLSNVRPSGWKNPVPQGRYNLVVIGAGAAGLVTAAGAASVGAKVALIERHLLGGDCLNVGCVPSKGVIRASRAAAAVRGAAEFGVRVPDGVQVDFGAVMERMRHKRAGISPVDSARRYAEDLGVDVYFGQARFVAPDAIEVDGVRLEFHRAVIAAGARAAAPPIPGLEETGYRTNEDIFSLTERPRKLVVIGAGPIGCELGQAFRRLGSEVEIVSLDAQVLPREDPDAAAVLQRRLAEEGVVLTLGAKILRAARGGAATLHGGSRVIVYEKDGKKGEAVGDEILVAIGRAPNTDGLDLEAAGVAYDRSGITVDDYLRTTNRRIYAAGDIASKYKFTHAADAMARIVIRNALFFGRARASKLVIPWCTYTDPEIAHVGLYEPEALAQGLVTDTFTVPLHEVDRAVLDGQDEGFARALVRKGTDEILGLTIVAAHAGEMIGEAVLALRKGLGLSALAETIHPYPTQAEALRKLGDAYNRTRLTPRAKGFLTRFLAWRRG